MFPVRLTRVLAGAALNRRVLEDQFQAYAEQLNDLGEYNIALKALTRQHCKIDAVEEIWDARSKVFDSTPHKFYNQPILNNHELIIDGDGGDFVLDWNIDLTTEAATIHGNPAKGRNIRIIPFAAGKLLWEAADILLHEWPLTKPGSSWTMTPPNDVISDLKKHSLSGQCVFSTLTGSFEIGLFAANNDEISEWDDSYFEGAHAQIVVRRKH